MIFPFSAFTQTRPPNDDLTNATVLTGTDVTFAGNLAGATLEPNEQTVTFGTNYSYIDKSIWWTWQAPVSAVLNMQLNVLRPYAGDIPYHGYPDKLFIYSASNGTTGLGGLQLPALTNTYPFVPPKSTASIYVSAGTAYYFQLIGASTNNYQFHLTATNTPLIFRQPASQTVSSNSCTIFYVDSGGLSPRTFQWFFNGTNIPGQTKPILALYHIDSTMAGTYSVFVSNAGGSIMSAPATLTVSQSNVPPVLVNMGRHSNVLSFNLLGEFGRAYRIESSTNLVNWTGSNSFPFSGSAPSGTSWSSSVVYATNLPLSLMVASDSPRGYYRASIYKTNDADAEICINNLRQILIAKDLWRTESMGDYYINTPSFADLALYLPVTNLYCPDDPYGAFYFSYNIGTFWQTPTCLFKALPQHELEGVP